MRVTGWRASALLCGGVADFPPRKMASYQLQWKCWCLYYCHGSSAWPWKLRCKGIRHRCLWPFSPFFTGAVDFNRELCWFCICLCIMVVLTEVYNSAYTLCLVFHSVAVYCFHRVPKMLPRKRFASGVGLLCADIARRLFTSMQHHVLASWLDRMFKLVVTWESWATVTVWF